jgi:hypothetical protein
MPHEDAEPKSRQERKSKGKFNKKYTDEKYNSKHVRAYEATFSQKVGPKINLKL